MAVAVMLSFYLLSLYPFINHPFQTSSSPMLCLKFTVCFVGIFWQTLFMCVNGHQPFFAVKLCHNHCLCNFLSHIPFQSEHLADVLLRTNWLDRSIKYRKDFIFVVARSQTPLNFYAKYISIYNYQTLLMVSFGSFKKAETVDYFELLFIDLQKVVYIICVIEDVSY